MKVILLNGPPGSGKDTIGAYIWSRVASSCLEKFARPIVEFMLSHHGINMETVEKDKPHPNLHGRTPREAAIRYSEGYCKPLFGQHYFGHCALDRLATLSQFGQELVIFTDSGFVAEVIPLLQSFNSSELLQIRITRPTKNYQGDSRSTWDHPQVGHIDFDNDARSKEDLFIKIEADLLPEIQKWLTK